MRRLDLAFKYLYSSELNTYLVPVTLLPLRHPTHYLAVYAHSDEEAYILSIDHFKRSYKEPQSFLTSPYQCFRGELKHLNNTLFRMKDEVKIISKALEESHLAKEYPEME